MSLLVSLAMAVVLLAFWMRHERDRHAAEATIAALTERLREVTLRVDAVEHEAVAASAHAEIAERVLLEKGYADPDDLEHARLRLEGEAARPARTGELN
jgi:uncharacterized membrane protein